jgi:hypothetical protein
VAGHRLALDLADRLGLVRRGIAAGQDDLALGEVLAGADPEPRLARDELLGARFLLLRGKRRPLVVLPEIAVAGIEEYAVALADLLDPGRLDPRLMSSAVMMPGLSVVVGIGSRSRPRCLSASRSTPRQTKPFAATCSTPRSPMPTTMLPGAR